jgi:hypothetical protein
LPSTVWSKVFKVVVELLSNSLEKKIETDWDEEV